jgi:hypothetical protein
VRLDNAVCGCLKPACTQHAHLSIHFMAHLAFRSTQGTVVMAWNSSFFFSGSFTYASSSRLYISAAP